LRPKFNRNCHGAGWSIRTLHNNGGKDAEIVASLSVIGGEAAAAAAAKAANALLIKEGA
jgi:hypothetical protein